ASRLVRRLRAARCPGLDDGRAARCAVDRDRAHGPPGRPRDFPHCRRGDDPPGPRAGRSAGTLLLRRRRLPPLDRQGPLVDLRRLPPLRDDPVRARVASLGTSSAQEMDAIYRYQRYIYDATRKYYLFGRDRLIANLDPPERGTVLEIACGTGRNLIC